MNMKQIAIRATVSLAIVALAILMWEFREALILFVFSLAIAAAARPFVELLSERGIPPSLSIVLFYVLFVAVLVLIFWSVGSSFLTELQHLTDALATTYDQIWSTWPKGSQIQQLIVRQLPAPADLYKGFSPERQSSALNGILGFTVSSVSLIGQVFTVLVLSIYWTIDRVHFERLWLSLLPVESRARSRDIWRNIEYDFGAYVRSELLQSMVAGILLGLGLWAMHVPYPTLLGIFGGLAWFIPWLGGVLAILPVTLVALSQGPLLGVVASLYAIAVLFFLEFVIEPRFIRRRQFSSLLSILLIIALIEPYGLMGLIVAPPLAAALELIFRYNLQARQTSNAIDTTTRISELRARANRVRTLIASSETPPGPQIEGILSRLEQLIDRADQELEKSRTGT